MKPIKSSPELLEFYNLYQEWAEADAPEHPYFDCGKGLCWNLDMHEGATNQSGLIYEMTDQFDEADLDEEYPFGDQELYAHESQQHIHHRNKERLSWLAQRIADGEYDHE